jgi:hypothetical protein
MNLRHQLQNFRSFQQHLERQNFLFCLQKQQNEFLLDVVGCGRVEKPLSECSSSLRKFYSGVFASAYNKLLLLLLRVNGKERKEGCKQSDEETQCALFAGVWSVAPAEKGVNNAHIFPIFS